MLFFLDRSESLFAFHKFILYACPNYSQYLSCTSNFFLMRVFHIFRVVSPVRKEIEAPIQIEVKSDSCQLEQ